MSQKYWSTKGKAISSLADVLPQVSRDLDLDRKVGEMAMVRLWDEIIGESMAQRSRALKIMKRGNKSVLMVRVRDAATAGDLTFKLEAIREKLNSYTPQTGWVIDGIDLKIGTL